MRIVVFVYEYPPNKVGGLSTYAENIYKAMKELGHEILIITLNTGELKTREQMDGIDVHRPLVADGSMIFPLLFNEDLKKWGPDGKKFFSDIHYYNALSANKLIHDLMKNEDKEFDIIVVHDWLSAEAGVIAKVATGLPMVFHFHSTEGGRSGNGSPTVRDIEKRAAEIADKVITVSYPMKNDLPGFNDKISVCWNGIFTDKYNPNSVKEEDIQRLRSRYGIKPEEKMIFFIGRLTAVKGVSNLVKAMPTVLRSHPEAKLVIVGKGELQDEISDLIRNLNLGEKVKTRFEWLPEDEVILHYAACDLAVFPSLYEPFGIVALEAMSMAKPVIVGARDYRCKDWSTGFTDPVILHPKEEQVGLHINGNDPYDIAIYGIKILLDNPEFAKKLGENGRKRAEKIFNWRQRAEHTLKIYEDVIAQAKKSKK